MVFRDLRHYLDHLRRKGLLVEVDDEVSVDLEIAELGRMATYAHLPPLLFKRVRGFEEWKVLTNVFYSMDSMYDIFGTTDLEGISKEFLSTFGELPITFLDKVKSLPSVLKLGRYSPRSKRPDFEETELDLERIPATKTWPKDAGRYMTFSIVVTKDPETGVNNLSVYRIQILNKNEAIIHWQALKRGSLAASKYLEKGITRMPVAIVNGVDPVVLFTSASPVPPGLDKYLFAGILRGEGVDVTELENGLLVPSHAESVLEGYVDLNDNRLEGPFGDHLGYYTPPDYYPVFRLEKVYLRENPIYQVTSVGKPPLEDAWIGKGVERIFLPFLRMLIPDLVDMNLPEYGLFTGIGIFSMRKRYPGQARRLMMSLWGTGQLSFLKLIIIVDSDVNVHDLNQVLYAISTTVDPKRDVMIVDQVLNDSLDHTVPNPPLGSKMGIDATRKFKEEMGKEWPEEVRSDPEVVKKVTPIFEKIRSVFRPSA
ncbi:UbiD family decarboxylase [Metallosphaera yellowstonensis MK1]|uniref:UbiD family decarboxylase n=1 Tax=Metallosphaera yellowstonensis MK1 TaxID=671065 RepID=H2C8D6_9CREN|nr:UbiD family decarboxylase [Metallosphaera yellowstonensis]EHP68412.1 UbiD family decarboxylase [Metallosphaera yellowstonensis MK1]